MEKLKKEEDNYKEIKSKDIMKYSTLSIISSVMTGFKFIIVFIFPKIFNINNSFMNFLNNIPFIIISLILAIISRCTKKDTLSKVIIIIDMIYIIINIIAIVLLLTVFIKSIGWCMTFMDAIEFEKIFNGCVSIG